MARHDDGVGFEYGSASSHRILRRYHITSRGNEKKAVFKDDLDGETFLNILDRVNKRYGTRGASNFVWEKRDHYQG
jgi:hypothetical protein